MQTLEQVKAEKNLEMYGVADIDAYIDSVKESFTYKAVGGNMVVAGLMSDAQELIEACSQYRARQTLNRAKAVLFEIVDGRMIGNVNQQGE
jgi:hypothetical protein